MEQQQNNPQPMTGQEMTEGIVGLIKIAVGVGLILWTILWWARQKTYGKNGENKNLNISEIRGFLCMDGMGISPTRRWMILDGMRTSHHQNRTYFIVWENEKLNILTELYMLNAQSVEKWNLKISFLITKKIQSISIIIVVNVYQTIERWGGQLMLNWIIVNILHMLKAQQIFSQYLVTIWNRIYQNNFWIESRINTTLIYLNNLRWTS